VAREARLDETPLAERVRRADARKDDAADHKNGKDAAEIPRPFGSAHHRALGGGGPHALTRGVSRLATESDYSPEDWSLRLPYDSFLLTLARDEKTGEGVMFEQASARAASCCWPAVRHSPIARLARPTTRTVRQHRDHQRGAGGAVLFDDLRQGCPRVTIRRVSTAIRACTRPSPCC